MNSTLKSGIFRTPRAGFFGLVVAALSTIVGCGGYSENWQARTAVDEESQSSGSASLEAYPPSAPQNDVAIGVDTNKYEDTDPSALTEFRSTLEPYGTWEDTSTHGTVWVPATSVVGPDFVPYSTAGHWTYDGTWVWVSDYEWGWAPFHYGRWVLLPSGRWAWVPGRVYSGAWVTWAYGPTYVGWAPLAPSWYWYDGYAMGVAFYPTPYYVYCPHNHIFHPHVHTYVVHGPAAAPIAASTPPYVPARPSVGGPSRIPASPTVDPARVAASPSVGPSPQLLGQSDAQVVRPPSNGGLAKARALGNPQEAKSFGARAPASTGEFASGPNNIPRYAAPNPGVSTGAPPPDFGVAAARTQPSGFASGARMPSSPSSPVLSPAYPASRPAPRFESRSLGSSTIPSTAAPSYRPAPSPATPSPTFRSTPAPSAPTYRPAPAAVSPTYRAPSTPAPTFRSSPSPSIPSTPSPTFRSSPSPAPVYRAPSPAPMRAAPAPAPARPSTPAPSRPSSSPRAIKR